jgi:hypothetical protein
MIFDVEDFVGDVVGLTWHAHTVSHGMVNGITILGIGIESYGPVTKLHQGDQLCERWPTRCSASQVRHQYADQSFTPPQVSPRHCQAHQHRPDCIVRHQPRGALPRTQQTDRATIYGAHRTLHLLSYKSRRVATVHTLQQCWR